MNALVWVAVGVVGGLGALLRFLVDGLVASGFRPDFPLGTLIVNLTGAFILGFLVGLGFTGDGLLLAGAATIGSYTTFSTWMLESQRLVEDGEMVAAGANVLISLGAGSARSRSAASSGFICELGLSQAHNLFRGAPPNRQPVCRRRPARSLRSKGGRGECHVGGAEGFGVRHRLRTDRVLTLSEDLPLVSIAVDIRSRIESLLGDVVAIKRHGLITLERARLLSGDVGPVALPEELDEATKLTTASGAPNRPAACRRSSPSAICSTGTASPARPRCSASTGRLTECVSAHASSDAMSTSRR